MILEGPNAVDGVPGPVNGGFTPMKAVTDAAGEAVFTVPGLGTASGYRFVATVNVAGVGAMKFQSGSFNATPPIGD